jgi:rhodanese-related sulfurtransferase
MIATFLRSLIQSGPRVIKAAHFSAFKQGHADLILLDVRAEREARDEGFIPGSVRAELNTPAFADAARRFPKHRPLVVYCRSGSRSQTACKVLSEYGFAKIYHLEGGFVAWQNARKH